MEQQYYIYVLRSQKSGYRYIGQTKNVQKRLFEHNSGISRSTRNQKPFQLEYTEVYSTRREAMQRERFLKSGQGREWLDRNVSSFSGV